MVSNLKAFESFAVLNQSVIIYELPATLSFINEMEGYDKTFSVAGPTLCNALPKEIRLCKSVDSFKSNLKIHFLNKAFVWFLNK